MTTLKKHKSLYWFLFIFIALPILVNAQGNNEAAANAANPLAFVTKLQVQPNFTWKGDKARQINLTSRIIQPTGSLLLPFIKSKDPSKVYTIYRLEVPVIGQSYPSNKQLDATGLSDLILLDAVVLNQKWGMLGGGPALIIPTMKPDQLSSRKWSAGLVGVVINTKTKGFIWGVLVQQFFNFAGDDKRPDRNFMLINPIVNQILGKGTFVQFSPIWNWNMTAGTFDFPLSINIGKAFAQNLSAQFGPEYVISGPDKGDFTFRFQLNAMFPPSKK